MLITRQLQCEISVWSIDTVSTIKMFTSRRMTRSAWWGWWSWRWIWSTISDKPLQNYIFITKRWLKLWIRIEIGWIRNRPTIKPDPISTLKHAFFRYSYYIFAFVDIYWENFFNIVLKKINLQIVDKTLDVSNLGSIHQNPIQNRHLNKHFQVFLHHFCFCR